MISDTTTAESAIVETAGRQAARSSRTARVAAAFSALLLTFGAVSAHARDSVSITKLPAGAPFEIMPTELNLADFGYASEEYLFSGTARAYVAEGELGQDGLWKTVPGATAPYVARLFVRRPIDPAAFDGTVHVEWLNVTGQADNAVSWKYGHVEMLRSGTAYIGVTAQKVGSDAARAADPKRYGRLSHPGDSFSYDIFAQAAQAIRENSAKILPGLKVKQLIASGESQSSVRLTTYINGVHPHHPDAYDGFLVFSSGFGAAALSQEPQERIVPTTPVHIRGDLNVPVLSFQTEAEIMMTISPPPMMMNGGQPVAGDRLAKARQPDSDKFRLWELAGGTHVGAYFYNVGAHDDGSDSVVKDLAMTLIQPTGDKSGRGTCPVPINADPSVWVFHAALKALDKWAMDGTLPPSAPRFATTTIDGRMAIARDEYGNVMGGIRTPYVDAPVATLTGRGRGEGFCFLAGTTVPFPAATFRMRYDNADQFMADWDAATTAAVAAGFVTEADKARLEHVGEYIRKVPVSEWQPRSP